MRTLTWIELAAVVVLCAAPSVHAADMASDRAAAIAVFPLIQVQTAVGKDTVLELANTSASTLTAYCYFENANSHCSDNPSIVCETAGDCASLICVPGWSVNDFRVELTPRQSITWRASQGLVSVPLSGGSIPPAAEDPFVGALICIAADDLPVSPTPNDRNELRGAARIEEYVAGDRLDVATYSAFGIEAISGANDGDLILRLGGPSAEYAACPENVVLNHFTEGAVEPAANASDVHTRIAFLPCAQDLFAGQPGAATIQFLVYNEFEQRFSTSRALNGLLFSRLSKIDTNNPNLSIFSFNVLGTLAAHTNARGIPHGVIGVAIEERTLLSDPTQVHTAATEVHLLGIDPNEARLGQPPCGDGTLDADEDCDDGNTADGDCCPSNCQLDCATPVRSKLVIADHPTNPLRDRLVWRWNRGASSLALLGDPIGSNGYSLCIWDDNNLAFQASVAAGGTCGSDPCWSSLGNPLSPSGYKYKDTALASFGTKIVKLRAPNTTAFLRWLGKGGSLPLPGPVSASRYFNQASQVRAILFRDDAPFCWQSTYTTSVKNLADKFVAVSP